MKSYLVSALLCCLWTGSMAEPGAVPRVLVVFDAGNRIHQDFLEGLDEEFAALRFQGKVRLKRVPLADSAAESSPTQQLGSADLLVAVGSKISQRVLAAALPAPVLCVMVPRASYRQFSTRGASGSNRNASALYLDQPLGRQFALAQALKPGVTSIGVILSHSNHPRRSTIEGIARHQGIGLNLELVDRDDNLVAAIKRLLENSDVLVAVADPIVTDPSNAKWLLYMAYERRVPVIGFSAAFAKAGAVASLFATPEQLGRQTAKRIRTWAVRGWQAIASPRGPNHFELATNPSVARALGLRLPSDNELRALIADLEGSSP